MSDTPVFNDDDRVDDVEALMRELESSDFELQAPPDDLWAGIDAAVADDRTADVVPLTSRRQQFGTRFLAVAAAVAVIAVGAAVVTSISGGDEPVVATAELTHDADEFDPLGADSAATANLVEADGGYEIRLDDADLPNPGDDDLELWLIATTDDGLDVQPVSLVDPSEPGTYAVPAGLDPAEYSIVDISVEPRDGDETHSGRSILRGELDV